MCMNVHTYIMLQGYAGNYADECDAAVCQHIWEWRRACFSTTRVGHVDGNPALPPDA